MLRSSPRFELWRAAIDNDGMKLFLGEVDKDLWVGMSAKPVTRWLGWGLDALHRSPTGATVARRGAVATVTAKTKAWGHDTGSFATHKQTMTVWASGEIGFDETITVPDAWDDLRVSVCPSPCRRVSSGTRGWVSVRTRTTWTVGHRPRSGAGRPPSTSSTSRT